MSARRPPQWVLCPFYRTSGADAVFIPAMFLRSILLGAAAAVLLRLRPRRNPTLDQLKPCYVVAQENQRELVRDRRHGLHPAHARSTSSSTTSPQATADVLVRRFGPRRRPGAVRGVRPARRSACAWLSRASRRTRSRKVSKVTRVLGRADAEVGHDRRAGALQGPRLHAPGLRLRALRLRRPGRARRSGSAYRRARAATFNVKRLQFPFKKRPRIGSWTIQFDQLPYYDPMAHVQVPMTIKVKRAPKRSRVR